MTEAASSAARLDSREYHQLFVESQRRIYAFIRTLLPDFNDSQDVFQNTCIILLGKADQFEPGTDFTKWACRIAYYEVCNFRRRKGKETTFTSETIEALQSEQMQKREYLDARHDALVNCLEKLHPNERKLLEARYRRNASLHDVAAELARPLGTTKKILQRIRRNLQQCIERTLAREERGL